MRTPSPPLRRISSRHHNSCLAVVNYHRLKLSRHPRQIFKRGGMPAKIRSFPPIAEKLCSSPVSIAVSYPIPSHSSNSSEKSGSLKNEAYGKKKRSISPEDLLSRRGSHRQRSNLLRSKALRIPRRRGSVKSIQQQNAASSSAIEQGTKRQFSFEPSPKLLPIPNQLSTSQQLPASQPYVEVSLSLPQPQPIPPYPALPPQSTKPQPPPTQPQQTEPQPPSPQTQENLADLAAFVNLRLLQSLLQPPSTQPTPTPSARHLALRAFYLHILRRTHITPTHILVALKYVQRLCAVATLTTPSPPVFPSNPPTGLKLTPRAILLVSLVLAGKYLDDVKRYANSAWAEVGGMSVGDLNAAERECLSALGWNVVVSREEFDAWLGELNVLVQSANGRGVEGQVQVLAA